MSGWKVGVIVIAVLVTALYLGEDYRRNNPATKQCQQAIKHRRELNWPGGMTGMSARMSEEVRREVIVQVVEWCD